MVTSKADEQRAGRFTSGELHVSSPQQLAAAITISETEMDKVAKVVNENGNDDRATVQIVVPKPEVAVLYVGPFALDSVVQRREALAQATYH